jgi:hypothetical protein
VVEVPPEEVEPLPLLMPVVEAQALAKSHKIINIEGLYFCIILYLVTGYQ